MDFPNETRDACDQLMRYGGSIASAELLAVVQKITDINDDLWHGRDPALIRNAISEAKALLDKVPTA